MKKNHTIPQGLKLLWKQPRILAPVAKQVKSTINEHALLKFLDTLVNFLTSGMINIFKFVDSFNDP